MLRTGERGFTLIEMMIVVAIIAILVAILVPNFMRARAQAQTAACEANLKEIATALEEYETDHEAYPDVTAATNVTSTETNLGQYLARERLIESGRSERVSTSTKSRTTTRGAQATRSSAPGNTTPRH